MLGLLFGIFFILLALGVPILFSMGIAAGIYYVASDYPLMQFVQKTVAGVDSFTLLAIPFFLLAGLPCCLYHFSNLDGSKRGNFD